MKRKVVSISVYICSFLLLLIPFLSLKGETYSYLKLMCTWNLWNQAVRTELCFICVYLLTALFYMVTLWRGRSKVLYYVLVATAFLVPMFHFLVPEAVGALCAGNTKAQLLAMGILVIIAFTPEIEMILSAFAEEWKQAVAIAKEDKEREIAEKKEYKERTFFEGKYNYLFFRVIWKNFRSNWKDYCLLLICNIIIFAFIVIGVGMREILSPFNNKRGLGLFHGLSAIFVNALLPMAIISVTIIVILFLYYLKCRAKNNGIFLTIGMRRKMLYVYVAVEIISLLLVSAVAGSILGSTGLHVFVANSELLLGQKTDFSVIGIGVFLKSAALLLIMYLLSLMIARDILMDFRVGQNTDQREMHERIPTGFHTPILIAGLILSVGAAFLYGQRKSFENVYLLAILFVGGFGVFFIVLARKLINERKNPSYLKKLLLHNQLFHKFKTNSAYMYAVMLLQFCVLFYFSFQLISTIIAEDEEELYPYDLVCIAYEEDEDFFRELQEKYEVELWQYPMVRVSSSDATEQVEKGFIYPQGQHIGISETTYHELKKQLTDDYQKVDMKLDVEGEKIYVVYQQDRAAKAMPLDLNIHRKNPLLYTGLPCWSMNVLDVTRKQGNAYRYREIVGEEVGSLTGVFRQGRRENIVVFSDAYFEKAQKEWEKVNIYTGEILEDESERIPDVTIRQGPSRLVLMNVKEEDRAAVLEDMKVFQEKHKYDEKFDITVSSYYSKAEGVNVLRAERLMKIVMNSMILILFFIMNLMLIVIKLLSEKELRQRRSIFLHRMGMKKKERRSLMKKEVIQYFQILPIIISAGVAAIFTAATFIARMYSVDEIILYLKYMAVIWSGYIVASTVFVWLIVTIHTVKLEVKQYEGNS